jgi:hypothetical protein
MAWHSIVLDRALASLSGFMIIRYIRCGVISRTINLVLATWYDHQEHLLAKPTDTTKWRSRWNASEKRGRWIFPTNTYRALRVERRYSSYSFLTSALDGGEWSASRPGCALPPGRGPPEPTGQEAGWAPEPVWTQRLEEEEKSFAPNPGHPVRSQPRYWWCSGWETYCLQLQGWSETLYWQSYPGLVQNCTIGLF